MKSISFISCLAVLCIASVGQAAPPIAAVSGTRIISVGPYYDGWSTLRKLNDGRLMVVYSGGRDDHAGPLGRIESMESKDGGVTWTWPRVMIDTPIDDRDSGLCQTSKGTLLISFMTSLSYEQHMNNPARRINKVFGKDAPAVIARWKSADARTTPEEKAKLLGPYNGKWMIRSTDGGLSWSSPYPVPVYNTKGPTALSDGRLVYGASDGKSTGLWESTNDGLTWSLASAMPLPPGEMDMVEAGNGDLVVQVRSKSATHQTLSKDHGKTWSAVQTVAQGYPPHLLRLKNNTLLMTYGWRRSPFGIRAKASHDNGQTWSEEMIISQDGAGSDLGYPSTAELADGTLVTVWYEVPKDSTQAVLRQATWRINGF